MDLEALTKRQCQKDIGKYFEDAKKVPANAIGAYFDDPYPADFSDAEDPLSACFSGEYIDYL